MTDSFTTLGQSPFFGSSKLETVNFGENSKLTTINALAIGSCDALTSYIMPSSVKTIDISVFNNCPSLNRQALKKVLV